MLFEICTTQICKMFVYKHTETIECFIDPQHYYNAIPMESLVMTHQVDGNPMEIKCCMKEHVIVLKPKKNVF